MLPFSGCKKIQVCEFLLWDRHSSTPPFLTEGTWLTSDPSTPWVNSQDKVRGPQRLSTLTEQPGGKDSIRLRGAIVMRGITTAGHYISKIILICFHLLNHNWMRQTSSEIVHVTILWSFDLDPLLAILEVLSMSIYMKVEYRVGNQLGYSNQSNSFCNTQLSENASINKTIDMLRGIRLWWIGQFRKLFQFPSLPHDRPNKCNEPENLWYMAKIGF